MEVAKLRAARILWAELMAQFKPQNPASSMLRTHCQTSGVSLQEQIPTTTWCAPPLKPWPRCSAAPKACTPTPLTKPSALPTPFSARIARNTQIIIAEETGVTRTIDPLGGSYYVESLTESIVVEARKLIDEVEALGGMTKAVPRACRSSASRKPPPAAKPASNAARR